MVLKKIVTYGSVHLNEKTREVEEFSERERLVVRDMADTMYATRGIGLAAPQIGINLRIVVVDVDYLKPDEENPHKNLRVFINPEILWESDKDAPFNEGCLSIPGVDGEVFRPVRVKVNYRDEQFLERTIEADGLLARVLQHEIDHLNGTLFVDRLGFVKRKLVAGQLNRIKKEITEEKAGE